MTRLNENSDHYVGFLQQCLTDHLKRTGEPGLVMASFDTELFGHWWFEGVTWIKEVIKKLRQYTAVTMRTASEYLEAQAPTKAIELPESSWGSGGHWQVWLNNETEWMWPIISECEHTTETLCQMFENTNNDMARRAIKQLCRENLLIQSSDWPFLVTTGQAKQYAVERFNGHYERFKDLAKMLRENNFDNARLSEIESIDNLFPDVSPSWFLSQQVSTPA